HACWRNEITPRHPLAVEENVFGFHHAGEVALTDDPRRHVPVERARAAAGLFHTVAVSVVHVAGDHAGFGGAGNPVFRVVGTRNAIRRVGGHISGGVVAVAGELIVHQRGEAHILRRTLCHRLSREIAPGIVTVAVTPIFGLRVDGPCGAFPASI